MLLRDQIDAVCGVSSKCFYAKKDDRFRVRTLHMRLKDKHAQYLDSLACQVNMVWNFCNDLSYKMLQRENRFCSAFDIHPYLAGAGKAGLDLHSQTIQGIADEFVTRRKQFKKAKLRWRVSKGSRKSLGWIPFKSSAISYSNGQVHLNGKALSLWDSFGLADFDLGSGSISQDARGRWYINIVVRQYAWPLSDDVERPEPVWAKSSDAFGGPTLKRTSIGIDLGLKDLFATSNGQKVRAQQFYRKTEEKLAVAQRANKPTLVRALHAKIANQRNDFCHKETTNLARSSSFVFIGNVNASGLAKTNKAKSVLDAGWSQFRAQLQYKCDHAGIGFIEINESYTTQECSCCHARTGPKGQEDLGIRNWTCTGCGANHDRDTNAAINIRNRGLRLVEQDLQARKKAACQSASVAMEEKSSEVGRIRILECIAP